LHLGSDTSTERVNSAEEFMVSLKKADRLPGWPKNAKGQLVVEKYSNSITFRCWKPGDFSTFYHYEFTRTSKAASWKLQKAWRTNKKNRVIEKYPVP
ncbi:MAG TPA: hypothetical protein VG754_04585, partial [Verrucomicrobiae bacterium]|nr:hypothetical protein [Verrucomicrobiae bacterium]